MRTMYGIGLPAAAILFLGCIPATAQNALTYQKPPAAIEKLLDAPVTPIARVSPDRKTLLIEQPATFPTIADEAAPRYRLAGLRFNPATNGPSRGQYSIAISLQTIEGGAAHPVTGLPAKLRASNAIWSPDSRHIAFVQRNDKSATTAAGLQLWVIDVAAAHAHPVGTSRLNAILGRTPCEWMPDSAALLCKIVPATRGGAPKVSDVPTGPHVSENLGKVTPAPTYEDMLSTPDDENIFEYYATAQLAIVPLTGPVHPLAIKGLLDRVSPSPDGHYALVSMLHRPFSYTVPSERFPTLTEIVTLKTGAAKTLLDRPVVDNLPISRDAVAAGPRDYEWRSDAPATLVWAIAPDGGDPAVKSEFRDTIMALSAPFDGEPQTLLNLPMRLARGGMRGGGGIQWGNDHLAIISVSRFSDRKTMMLAFDPSSMPAKTTVLYQGSSQDRYHAPGEPAETTNAAGQRVIALTPDGKGIYFFSQGASRGGDKPFVAVMPVTGGEEKILWRSADPYYADPVALLGGDKVLIRRESQTESPNYFTASLADTSATLTPITHFPSPYAGIDLPTKQLLHYKRNDGVELTTTLWLPAGYNKSQGPLPTLMEAYPAEFKDRAAASQTSGSPNRFPRIGWGSPVFFTQTGYAVLENAAIPIIGEGKAEPNDTYNEQLVAGAKAAVDEGVSLGAVDPKRVAVMGHSYGAFMTANLLAHSNLFRAGIARSGAYNRTLTPYGFQNEERTYWQAPGVYHDMSPFSFADKIKTPILLIHGEADDNTGTYPIQSERFYAALKGQGATVRLVFLPLEAHGYEAHESLSHMLWEMSRWLDTYVKPEVSPVNAASR
jgi:dipeptidyl aminopeptidase/acylaminoacyl peptidase